MKHKVIPNDLLHRDTFTNGYIPALLGLILFMMLPAGIRFTYVHYVKEPAQNLEIGLPIAFSFIALGVISLLFSLLVFICGIVFVLDIDELRRDHFMDLRREIGEPE